MKYIRFIMKLMLYGLVLYSMYLPIHNVITTNDIMGQYQYTWCGHLVHKEKPSTIESYKYHSNITIEYTFILKDGLGTVKEIHPTATDYYQYKVGDELCYSFKGKAAWSETKPRILGFILFGWNTIGIILLLLLLWFTLFEIVYFVFKGKTFVFKDVVKSIMKSLVFN